MVKEILAYNKQFVENKGYESYITNKYPDKKIAILSCMDTRLTALLPAALGIKNGDVKMIKNAGGVISHPFGSVIRSLLVAIFELGVEEIMVIAHSDCGACHMHSEEMIEKMKDGAYIINTARGSLIDAKALLTALKSGKLGGAGLDTYEFETPIFNHDLNETGVKDELFKELVALDNVVMTPHIAFYTETAVENMVNIALDSAKSVIETGTAPTLVQTK